MRFYLYFLFFLILTSGCITGEIINEDLEDLEIKEGPFKVTKVIDGDTIDLNNSKRVRLSGINTPEIGECYYQEAKEILEKLVLNKEVFLEQDFSNEDKYGRILRYVYINNLLVNSFLVKEGYAKVYDKYSYDTKKYDALKEIELTAKNNNLGVWVCKDPKENCLYVASKNSNLYHKPDCKFAKRIKPENLICFKSKEEAEEAGYTPSSCS